MVTLTLLGFGCLFYEKRKCHIYQYTVQNNHVDSSASYVAFLTS